MFPRRPILLGGLIAPVLWTGLLYSILGLLNPLLQAHIDWFWFIASQVAFGIVAGFVVVRQSRITTRENLSFALRAGIEAPGTMPPQEWERNVRERLALSMCIRGAGDDAALGLRHSARPAAQRFGNAGAERGVGLSHAVRGKLRRLPRRGRTGRCRHRACRSGLSGHRGRNGDAQDDCEWRKEPRCRRSRKAPAECSQTSRSM